MTDNKPSTTPDVAMKCAEEIVRLMLEPEATSRLTLTEYTTAIIRKYIPVWTRIEKDKPETLPKKYAMALLAHTDTGDGKPTVEEAQWDGGDWVLSRTNGYGETILVSNDHAYAWMEIPSAPPEEQ